MSLCGNKAIILLRSIKLELYHGKMVVIFGISGADKSALIACLNGNKQAVVSGPIQLIGEELYKNYE